MKILLVITKAEIGGAQNSVLNLARELKRRDINVSVAAGEGNFLPQQLAIDNIPFYRLYKLKRNYNPFSMISYIKELKELINKEKFTTIHFNSSNSLPGVMATRKTSAKSIFTIRGLSVLDKNYPANVFKKVLFLFYFRFFFSFLDYPVFISEDNLKKAIKLKLVKKGIIIYNGLKLEHDHFLIREDARNNLNELINDININDSFLIGSTGRLHKQKNYQFLIDNFKSIKEIKPNAKLIIIGDGPERENYQKLIEDNNLENDIFLLGEKKQASKLLKGFDLFVLPSLYEGLSISLIETVQAEVPVLASDVGGNREVIGGENCFNLNDKKDFLNKLKRGYIRQDNQNKFPIGLTVDKYVNLYER